MSCYLPHSCSEHEHTLPIPSSIIYTYSWSFVLMCLVSPPTFFWNYNDFIGPFFQWNVLIVSYDSELFTHVLILFIDLPTLAMSAYAVTSTPSYRPAWSPPIFPSRQHTEKNKELQQKHMMEHWKATFNFFMQIISNLSQNVPEHVD